MGKSKEADIVNNAVLVILDTDPILAKKDSIIAIEVAIKALGEIKNPAYTIRQAIRGLQDLKEDREHLVSIPGEIARRLKQVVHCLNRD